MEPDESPGKRKIADALRDWRAAEQAAAVARRGRLAAQVAADAAKEAAEAATATADAAKAALTAAVAAEASAAKTASIAKLLVSTTDNDLVDANDESLRVDQAESEARDAYRRAADRVRVEP